MTKKKKKQSDNDKNTPFFVDEAEMDKNSELLGAIVDRVNYYIKEMHEIKKRTDEKFPDKEGYVTFEAFLKDTQDKFKTVSDEEHEEIHKSSQTIILFGMFAAQLYHFAAQIKQCAEMDTAHETLKDAMKENMKIVAVKMH